MLQSMYVLVVLSKYQNFGLSLLDMKAIYLCSSRYFYESRPINDDKSLIVKNVSENTDYMLRIKIAKPMRFSLSSLISKLKLVIVHC